MKLFFLDLENTGTDAEKHGVHQISGKIVINGITMEHFNFKVAPHPSALITLDALKVCNVTYEQIRDYPPMAEVFKQLMIMICKYIDILDKSDRFHIVAYNGQAFDLPHFIKWFFRCGSRQFFDIFWTVVLDAMILAANYLADKRHLMINFKQSTVAEMLGINVDSNKLHDAEYDIDLCHQIYDKVGGKY